MNTFAKLDKYFKLNEVLKQTTNKARRRAIIYEMDKLLK